MCVLFGVQHAALVLDASTADGQVYHGQFTYLKMLLYEKEGDYHNSMNADSLFLHGRQSIVVLDGASYIICTV